MVPLCLSLFSYGISGSPFRLHGHDPLFPFRKGAESARLKDGHPSKVFLDAALQMPVQTDRLAQMASEDCQYTALARFS